MSDRVFVDTNIFVYAVSTDGDPRTTVATHLIDLLLQRQNGVISHQVVQEFLNVVLSKFRKPLQVALAREYVATVFQSLNVMHSSLSLFTGAIDISVRYKLSWYDSLIVAAASEGKCSVLYTEDLQHGMRFGGVRVENPFLVT
jgi:predicted nucleic acid-binding protein